MNIQFWFKVFSTSRPFFQYSTFFFEVPSQNDGLERQFNLVAIWRPKEPFRPGSRRRATMPSVVKAQCANVKSRKFPQVRCPYPATKDEFCCRHWKKPRRFVVAKPNQLVTRSMDIAIKRIQKWWRCHQGSKLRKQRSLLFFARDLCKNDRELATFEPLSSVPRDYFIVLQDKGTDRYWGFDIRSLVNQYEHYGKLENPYTKELVSQEGLEQFHLRVALLRRLKKPLHFEEISGLSAEQSWNLRVLDVCLRLDMLGYRIATQWFSDLNVSDHQRLYTNLYSLWNMNPDLPYDLKDRIVPKHNEPLSRLFKMPPHKMSFKTELNSLRRMNLNLIERIISSADAQSDRVIGAMYSVIGISTVSKECRRAYPWLNDVEA